MPTIEEKIKRLVKVYRDMPDRDLHDIAQIVDVLEVLYNENKEQSGDGIAEIKAFLIKEGKWEEFTFEVWRGDECIQRGLPSYEPFADIITDPEKCCQAFIDYMRSE